MQYILKRIHFAINNFEEKTLYEFLLAPVKSFLSGIDFLTFFHRDSFFGGLCTMTLVVVVGGGVAASRRPFFEAI
jgi:hypothetical protein